MTRDHAKKIIEEEQLKLHNIDERQPLRENQVVLRFENNEWLVFTTSERASAVTGSIYKYKTESGALEDFVGRLRAANYLLNA